MRLFHVPNKRLFSNRIALLLAALFSSNFVAAQETPPDASAPSAASPSTSATQNSSSPIIIHFVFKDADAPPGNSTDSADPKSSEQPQLPTVTVKGVAIPLTIFKAAKDAGYYVKILNNQPAFCKKEAPVGSRFIRENCLNEGNFKIALQRVQQNKDFMQTMVVGGPHFH